MAIFFIVFITVYVLVHYYIFHKITTVFHMQSTAYFITLAVVILLALWGILAQSFAHTGKGDITFIKQIMHCGYIWLGTMSIIFSFFIVSDILIFFIRNDKFIYYSTLCACILAGICSVWSVINVAHGPVIKNLYIKVPNLSADILKAVHLSDIHIDAYTKPEEIKKIVAAVNSFNPDILFFTGDLADSDITETYSKYNLDKIKSKYGIFAVSGNHEYYTGINKFFDVCSKINATVLHNKNILVDDMIYVAGVPDIKTDPTADYKAALQGTDSSKPVIFLSHQPQNFKEVSKYPVTLQLSGHTHAGQIPPFDIIEFLFLKYFYGLYTENGSDLYVTTGTRWWGPQMRLFSRSEIIFITLHK